MVIATARRANQLGAKHRCGGCGKSFYDLGREAPSCPRCEWVWVKPMDDAVPIPTAAERRAAEEEDRRARMLGGLDNDERVVAQQSGKLSVEVDDIESNADGDDLDDDGDDDA